MGTKTIVIIFLAMLVVLLIGFLLGQFRRKPAKALPNTRYPPTKSAVSTTEVVTAKKLETLAPKQLLKDYSQLIAKANIYNERLSAVIAMEVIIKIHEKVFENPYMNFYRAYENIDTEKNEHGKEELLTFISSLTNSAKFGNAQKEINIIASDVSDAILEIYNEQLSTIFSGQSYESLSSRYELSIDLHTSQKIKISAIVVDFFSHILSELREIEQMRAYLESNYQNYANSINDDFDWEAMARSFGAGALTAINPFIGIPALIANAANNYKKDNEKNSNGDRYIDFHDAFEGKMKDVRQSIFKAYEQVYKYIYEKNKEINCKAINKILSDLAVRGCNIDHYLDNLEFKKINELYLGMENKKLIDLIYFKDFFELN
jgi:hypothetical protein